MSLSLMKGGISTLIPIIITRFFTSGFGGGSLRLTSWIGKLAARSLRASLPVFPEVMHCVFEGAIDFFAAIENILRVKYFFGFFKKFDDFFSVHLFKIGSSD